MSCLRDSSSLRSVGMNFIVSTAISLLKKYKNRIISVKITNFVLMQPVQVLPVKGVLV